MTLATHDQYIYLSLQFVKLLNFTQFKSLHLRIGYFLFFFLQMRFVIIYENSLLFS